MESQRYQVVPVEHPRYGHTHDVVDTHMQLPENRIAHACADEAHARSVASSLNYWHECRIEEGSMARQARADDLDWERHTINEGMA